MLKIVKDRISSSFNPENIVYFSFDDFWDSDIKDVINAYSDLMAKDTENGDYLFLFDEVQKVESWEEKIKRIYDNNPNFKIIISSSESLFIRKKAKDSLAGRCFEFKIEPLSFPEFLVFKGVEIKNNRLYEKELKQLFQNYMMSNGFPEMVDEDAETRQKYTTEIVEKVIYRDIPALFPVREAGVLHNIFKIIMADPGEIISLNDLAGELGVTRQTVSSYLDYLEKSFMIRKLYNFSGSVRKSSRNTILLLLVHVNPERLLRP